MSLLVSVIMPAYNAERYITDSIQSVLDQTYPHWELIVIDDGSTDSTARVAGEFAGRDGRVKCIRQPNGKQAKARNTGIANSSGTLIAFLDSDDLWMKEKLALQIEKLEETRADVVFSDGFLFNDYDTADESETFPIVRGLFEGRDLFDLLLIENRIPVLSVVLRRRRLDEVGLFDEDWTLHGCEDYDLWLRLAKHGAVFYGMTERLVKYRRHAAATTHIASNALRPMIRTVRRHINDGRLSEKEKRQRLRRLYRNMISALVEEGEMTEARRYMREFCALDRANAVTVVQSALLRIAPGNYNLISRECLYRAEWHLGKMRSRIKAG